MERVGRDYIADIGNWSSVMGCKQFTFYARDNRTDSFIF